MALFVEGLVILASILAALLLEGWRADRELERELTQELESVHRKLGQNRGLVTAELSVLERLTSGAADLIGRALRGSGERVGGPMMGPTSHTGPRTLVRRVAGCGPDLHEQLDS